MLCFSLRSWAAVFFAAVFFAVTCRVEHSYGGTFELENSRDVRLMRAKQRAAQFLSHATFGPTRAEVDALSTRITQIGLRRACNEWIDQQFEMPATTQTDTITRMMRAHGFEVTEEQEWIIRYRYHAFYHNALRAPDQLRQRAAWALSQIFVISDTGGGFDDTAPNRDGIPHWLGPSSYYDKLIQGVTGDYRTILEDVTFHPVMGTYLSSLRNSRSFPDSNAFPDENYAREVMQLFSIGLHELQSDGRPKLDDNGNLIATYDNETIRNLARVFTGLNYSRAEHFWWGEPRDFVSPMEMWEEYHDPDEKVLVDGTVLPAHSGAPGDGVADIRATLDNLAAHENVGPFISRRLIQRLVRSNPSRAYIRRVARVFDSNSLGERGDMKSVIRAVLMDPEAWRGVRTRRLRQPTRLEVIARGTEYSRLQEPMLRYLALIRALEPTPTYNGASTDWVVMSRTQWDIAQSPFGAPSVFNFYLPTFQPAGPLLGHTGSRRLPEPEVVAPEFQLMTPVMSNRMANRLRYELYQGRLGFEHWSRVGRPYRSSLEFDYSDWEERIRDEPEEVVDEMNWLLCRGTMQDDAKEAIVRSLREVAPTRPWLTSRELVGPVLYFVFSTPECAITQ